MRAEIAQLRGRLEVLDPSAIPDFVGHNAQKSASVRSHPNQVGDQGVGNTGRNVRFEMCGAIPAAGPNGGNCPPGYERHRSYDQGRQHTGKGTSKPGPQHAPIPHARQSYSAPPMPRPSKNHHSRTTLPACPRNKNATYRNVPKKAEKTMMPVGHVMTEDEMIGRSEIAQGWSEHEYHSSSEEESWHRGPLTPPSSQDK